MVSSYTFTQESQLTAKFQQEIADFWLTGEFSTFTSFDGLNIAFALFYSPNNQRHMVISPGRSEGYLKYKETAYDLFAQGYNVAIIDHRGQGLSERMLADPHKGFVSDFNDYVLDLQHFVQNVVKPKFNGPLCLMAHSMGCAISIRHLQQFPYTFNAAVLLSPMIAVNGGAIPSWVGKPLTSISYYIDSLISKQPSYFYSYGPYQVKAFADNKLTSCETRYNIFQQEYQLTPQLQLGGITFAWLQQAIKTEAKLFKDLDKITTPVYVIQAELDTIVRNDKQTKFCKKLHQLHPQSCPNGKPLIIDNALHELLFEVDTIRNQALSAALDWFDLHEKVN
ncbi:alpha/beta fold hydrolase [Thalassomonas sp. M1454]|uniref:alpha/beta fold hydrolase n=1 Tax=Thalassomonas sp. M1454 TaxID=2594477 RepID=UPI00117E6B2A|nr:alpha/beta fold hydrolase [Thalassomonas sp. M1454]TRX57918.1 alpha/beta fold hydrolase [Thalassomonas sp. M1454]